MDTNGRIDSYVNTGLMAYAAATATPDCVRPKERAAQSTGPEAARPKGRDQVELSEEGCRAAAREQTASFDKNTRLKMEAAIQSSDLKALLQAAKEQCGKLEVNWDRVVDPDGKIYSLTYVESVLRQYQCEENTIKAYYAKGHQENLTYDNPYDHILMKYKRPDSPYFRKDMSEAERDMAFRQERDLLWKGQVSLGDPYALAASGGALNVEEVDRIAYQAARDKIDEMIRAYRGE